MTLTSMQITQAPPEADCTVCADPHPPKYPYGLCIELNDESLAKLGIDALPAAGAVVMLTTRASVAGTGETDTQDGHTEKRMSLQITDMQVQFEGDRTPAQRLYVNSDMGR